MALQKNLDAERFAKLWKKIDAMELEISRLKDRTEELEDTMENSTLKRVD